MHWPKRVFGERFSAEAVLIGHHYELEIEIFAYESKITEYAFYEYELLKSVYLFVFRLLDKCAVTVYKKNFFQNIMVFYYFSLE